MCSILPIHPIRYEVKPPSQLPIVAQARQIPKFPPASSTAIKRADALKGIIVEARNEPINSPIYPHSAKNSI